MDKIIEQMFKQNNSQNGYNRKNSIKEVVQEIVLCGLSRANFFKSAAFYGGTALRIFYGLDRFSEDLDFSLRSADTSFDIYGYLPMLKKEIRSYGLDFKVEVKEKSIGSDIKSAFLKGNTKEHMLMFYTDEKNTNSINPRELIKIKIEIDTNPPDGAGFETEYKLLPIPYEITLYDLPSLFAGKIHAVICRGWKNRVKGRDLYDYTFYLARGAELNLMHLTKRLILSGHIPADEQLMIEDVKEMLKDRFMDIDYNKAKQDVLPFIKNPKTLDVWSAGFFLKITEGLK